MILCGVLACCLSTLLAQDAEAPKAPEAEAPKAPEAAFDYKAYFATLPENLAVIGDEPVVTRAEVLRLLTPQLENFQKNRPAALSKFNLDMLVYRFVRNEFSRKLLIRAALADGLEPDIEKAREFIKEAKENHGEELFKQLLKQQATTEEQLVKNMADSLMVTQYHEKIVGAIPPPTEEECRAYYEEHQDMFKRPTKTFQASHILAKYPSDPPTPEDEAAALKKIEQVRALLDDGADFADMAREHSDCPSGKEGGVLGINGEFAAGAMIPEFEEALVPLAPGEISAPVKTQFGYHLIKAGQQFEAGSVMDYEQVKEFIHNQALGQQKAATIFIKHLHDLEKTYQGKMFVSQPELPAPVAVPEDDDAEDADDAKPAEDAPAEQD